MRHLLNHFQLRPKSPEQQFPTGARLGVLATTRAIWHHFDHQTRMPRFMLNLSRRRYLSRRRPCRTAPGSRTSRHCIVVISVQMTNRDSRDDRGGQYQVDILYGRIFCSAENQRSRCCCRLLKSQDKRCQFSTPSAERMRQNERLKQAKQAQALEHLRPSQSSHCHTSPHLAVLFELRLHRH